MNAALTSIELPGIPRLRSGKVREVFDVGSHYLLVASDRLSAFDCILPNGIPQKGEVLNRLSAWWFHRLREVIPNHLVETDPARFPEVVRPYAALLRGRSALVEKAEVIPIECVARGYLIGSGWKDYQATGQVCGHSLPPGHRQAEVLPEPLFTPATKADEGHDENISFAQMVDRVGLEAAEFLRETTLRLYREAATYAAGRGIILADTKFEFGRNRDGRIILIDEALTPDSSRYWPAAGYAPGSSPPSFDKQFVRDYLENIAWNKQPPAPALPDEVIEQTRQKYLEVYRLLTGSPLDSAAP